MSKQENNRDNQKLRDLLNKRLEEPGGIDDFEREALEGFAMLQDTDEALELKKSLDKKIYAEVFSEKEEKSKRGFWYAAAGLLLVMGFSIYFLQKSAPAENDGLAIQSPVPSPGAKLQEDMETMNEKNQSVQFKPEAASSNEALSTKEKIQSAPKSEEIKSVKSVQAEQADDMDAESAPLHSAKALSSGPEENVAAPLSAAPAAPKTRAEPMLEAEKKEIATSNTWTEDVKKTSTSKDRTVLSDSVSGKADAIALSEIQVVSLEKKRKKKTYATTGAAPAKQPAAVVSATYEGGNTALNLDLKNLLEPKGLLKSFDATLMLDQEGKVQTVRFKNSFDLSKTQQKELTGLLKELHKFSVAGSSGKNPVTYELNFRP